MLNEPFATAARDMGLKPIVDLAAERIPWLFSTLVVSQKYLKENRDVMARFLRATAEGNYLALAEPARAKQVLAKGTRVTDPKIVEITYADFTQMTPLDLAVPRAGAENILAHFPQDGEPQPRRLYRPVDARGAAQGGPICRTRKAVREAVASLPTLMVRRREAPSRTMATDSDSQPSFETPSLRSGSSG